MKRLFTAALVAGGMLVGLVSTASAATVDQSFHESGPNTWIRSYSGDIGQTITTGITGYFVGFEANIRRSNFATSEFIDIELDVRSLVDGRPIGDRKAGGIFRLSDLEVSTNGFLYFDLSPFSVFFEEGDRFAIVLSGSETIGDTTSAYNWYGGEGYSGGQAFQGRATTQTSDLNFRTFVQPVPLPAGVWLLLSALGGLGLAGWRRKRMDAC